ncbi:MmoB/DmpM family protein [Zavarzinia compransoris]|uniref:MmoB/DmpM family protein n=1 Tax=Zavarzinia marina TaxID=2911065 RepID=UPI001F261EB3|nr:MmoB/DmpM family protein [Zavarzinia marina]MCF4167010.1 MmoB/DmpM family protein [Zavarzinia marina]
MTSHDKAGDGYRNNRVGPILRAGEVAQAAILAVEDDNPGKEIHIEDRTAYVRIECDGECILTRASMEEALGRPFQMREIEINLGSFSGQIDTSPDRIRFYLAKHI